MVGEYDPQCLDISGPSFGWYDVRVDMQFDVAISFLNDDAPIAEKLRDELCEHLTIFIYSEQQESLAGTDGLTSFREVFRNLARLVVVLYRDGWGKTRWTAVEETAIKERAFNTGWDFLLFVMLDGRNVPPAWLPETRIRLNYANYGAALPGAIKMRAQELGSDLKTETVPQRATRLQAAETARVERLATIANQGAGALPVEYQSLCTVLEEAVREIQPRLTTIKIESAGDSNSYVVRTDKVSFNCYIYSTMPVTESRLIVQEFDRPLILPGTRNRMFVTGEEPRVCTRQKFVFDYQPGFGWCWRPRDNPNTVFSTPKLGELLLKNLLDRHARVDDSTHKSPKRPIRYRM